MRYDEKNKNDDQGDNLFRLLCLALLFSSFHAVADIKVGSVPACAKDQLQGYEPNVDEVRQHRRFVFPGIVYPANFREFADWSDGLTVKVDRSGKVICYAAEDKEGRKFARNVQRSALVKQLASWRFEPFMDDGKAVDAVVRQEIYEWIKPETHGPWPKALLPTLHISLQRTACLGACPAYKLDIDYAGNVRYKGFVAVDTQGAHRFKMARAEISALIQSMQNLDIWSAPKYEPPPAEDLPDCKLTITFAREKRELGCGGGVYASLVRSWLFVHEIDRRAEVEAWMHFSARTLTLLKAEHFNFDSPESFNILKHALRSYVQHDEAAMLNLLDRAGPPPAPSNKEDADALSLLKSALERHHVPVVERLIANDALLVNGTLDQNSLDESFQAAIKGGWIDMVQRMWDAGGPEHHPSLRYTDTPWQEKATRWPVTLLLDPWSNRGGHWEGKIIAQWLAAKGCDLHADRYGETLLDIAIKAEDVEFEKYLRDIGVTAHRDNR